MKPKLKYHALARRDFVELAEWSRKQWGTAQTRRYLDEIETQFQRLVENPMLGQDAELPHPGLRKIAAGRHTIFYMASDRSVEIVRILHQQMDHAGRLGLL